MFVYFFIWLDCICDFIRKVIFMTEVKCIAVNMADRVELDVH